MKMSRNEALIGLGTIALAVVVALATAAIPAAPAYARVGPAFIGYIVAGGLGLFGVMLVVQAMAGGWGHEIEEEHVKPDIRALAWVGLGLFFNIALIGNLGFVFGATLMFVCIARGFGSRQPARDLLIGFVLTLVAYLGFDKLLGINIGGGILEGLI